jgi:hypothetical protein
VVLLPLQPPDAVQEVAFVEDHVSVDELPLTIEAGEAVKDIAGSGVGAVVTETIVDCAALPPAPVHVSV